MLSPAAIKIMAEVTKDIGLRHQAIPMVEKATGKCYWDVQAFNIMDKYFPDDEEAEPAVDPTGSFQVWSTGLPHRNVFVDIFCSSTPRVPPLLPVVSALGSEVCMFV